MADTPKHKLFFGIPYGKPTVPEKLDPGDTVSKGGSEPCWRWDTGNPVFSSGSLGFDCGLAIDDEYIEQVEAGGFSWDNDVVTMDTESLILN